MFIAKLVTIFLFSVFMFGCVGSEDIKSTGDGPINPADYPDQPGTIYGRWSMNEAIQMSKSSDAAGASSASSETMSLHRNLYVAPQRVAVEQTCYHSKQVLQISHVFSADITGSYIAAEGSVDVSQKAGSDECRLQITSIRASYRIQGNTLIMTNLMTGETKTATRMSSQQIPKEITKPVVSKPSFP